jgi:hypothetical protein
MKIFLFTVAISALLISSLAVKVKLDKYDDFNDFDYLNATLTLKNIPSGLSFDCYCKVLKTVSVVIVRIDIRLFWTFFTICLSTGPR